MKYSVRGLLPPWLTWENESTLAGTPPPANEDSYKIPISISATYTAFGMSHVIESRMELDVRRPGTNIHEMALRTPGNAAASVTRTPGMETGMETYLDDDDDDMMYMGQQGFSSENTTPQSAVTPSLANPNQLLFIPSQSLQNSPLKQSMGPTPPSGQSMLSITQSNPLTPSVSPGALQYNQHLISNPRQPSSAPQTPIAGPPSQLPLQVPSHDPSSHSVPPANTNSMQFMGDVQNAPMMYGSQSHMTPNSVDSGAPRNNMYGIEEELSDNHSTQHNYFEDSYPLELGSPFLER